jgi:hypothetical protein
VTTTQVLRPDSDVATFGTITRSTGAVNFSLVDDAPSDDATYITSAQFGAGFYCGLTNLSALGGTQRVKRVKMRIRGFHNSADVGHVDQVDGRLRDNLNGKTVVAYTFSRQANTATEDSSGWYTADANGAAWTEAFVNRMQITFGWRCRSTGVTQLRLTEAYVDVEVDTQPTVTAVTITGAASSTRPGWSCTYTTLDDDGVQTRIQVRVFSAAQYGASNFSPDTSPATWDSGIMVGAATSGTTGAAPFADPHGRLGVDLVNGVTYKWYVRAARDWPGPAGPLWWSDWGVSSATAVSLTPPPTPTLTLSTVATAPGNRVLADVTSPVNLLTADNASFEGGLGQTVALANCTVSQSATTPADGAFCLQMSSTAGGDMTARSGNEPFLGQHVDAGTTYTALASFRTAVSARSCAVGIRWQDATGAAIGADVYGSNITDATGAWTQAFLTAAAPGNAVTAQVLYKVATTGGAAEVHRVDKADLHVGSSTVWTPGGFAAQAVTVERGERVDGTRGPRDNWAHPDVASAGSVRMTAGYGFKIAGDSGQDVLSWEYLDKDIPGGGPSGMLHWQTRSGAVDHLVIGTWPYGGDAETEWQFPIVAGQSHTVSYWVWVASGSLTLTPKIEWMADDVTTIASTSTGSTFVATTTPTLYSYTATAPSSGASSAHGVLTNGGAVATADVYVTRIGWGLGTVAVDDKPAAGGPLVWSAVRGATAVNLAGFPFGYTAGQRSVVADPEAPPLRPMLYRARMTATVSGTAVASAYSAYVTTLLTAPTRTVLKDPFAPERPAVVSVRPGDSAGSMRDAVELHPSGRDGDPVQITSWSGRQRSLELSVLSDAELRRLSLLLDSTRPLLLQWPEGGQTYGYVTSWSPTRVVRGRYHSITAALTETARPS